jgi:hypothetical protein
MLGEWCRESMIKKAAPTGVAEGGVNHNEALCTALKALADVFEAKGCASSNA